MHRRHPCNPVPRLWLMTDERMGDALWSALRRLPPGSGVVFRHYGLNFTKRSQLFRRVRQVARARRLILVLAGADQVGLANGAHNRRGNGMTTWAAHDRREVMAAVRAGASAVFVSPVYPTRSHPGAAVLGPSRARAMVRGVTIAAIALGGMNAKRGRKLIAAGFHGWAAIDAWSR